MDEEDLKLDGDFDVASLERNARHLEQLLIVIANDGGQHPLESHRKAKKIMNDFVTKHDSVPGLLSTLETSQNIHAIHMATVYIRQIVDESWNTLNQASKRRLKRILLSKLESAPPNENEQLEEQEKQVKLAVAACVTSVAKIELLHKKMNGWVELIVLLKTICNPERTNSLLLHEIGVKIWRNLIQFCGDSLKSQFTKLLILFTNLLNENESLTTQVEVFHAVGVMCEFLEKDHNEFKNDNINNNNDNNNNNNNDDNKNDSDNVIIDKIESIVPDMCAVMTRCIESNENELIMSCIDVFDDIIDTKLSILNNHCKVLADLFESLILTRKDNKQENNDWSDVRKKAITFLSSMVTCIPNTVIKQDLPNQFLDLCIQLLVEHSHNIYDEGNKNNNGNNAGDENKDKDEDGEDNEQEHATPLNMSCTLLDEIFKELPSDIVYPLTMHKIQILLNDKDFSKHEAGYVVIAIMIEGCNDFITQKADNLKTLVHLAVKGCRDYNKQPRKDKKTKYSKEEGVCKTALEALTQIASYILTYYLTPYFESIFDTIIEVLTRKHNTPQLINRGLSAIEFYFDRVEECDQDDPKIQEISAKYIPKAMEITTNLYINGPQNPEAVQSQCLQAISSISQFAGVEFQPYLQTVLNLLDGILVEQNNAKFNLELCCQGLSMLGNVAQAVGWNNFQPHFAQYHKIAMNLGQDISDYQFLDCFCAYLSEICLMMGQDFSKLQDFNDIITHIMIILQDDEGLEMEMPDDGFGDDVLEEDDDDDDNNDEAGNIDPDLQDIANMPEEELNRLVQNMIGGQAQDDDEDDGAVAGNENVGNNNGIINDVEDEHDEKIAQMMGEMKNVRLNVASGFMEAKASAINCLANIIQMSDVNGGLWDYIAIFFENFERLWEMPNELLKGALLRALDEMIRVLIRKHNNDNNNGNNMDVLYWKVGKYSKNDARELFSNEIQEYITTFFPVFIDAIVEETEIDVLSSLLDNFTEHIKLLGPASIHNFMPQLMSNICKFLNRNTSIFETGDTFEDDEYGQMYEQLGDNISKYEHLIDSMTELISDLALLYSGKDYMQYVWIKVFPILMKNYGLMNNKKNDTITVGCIATICENLRENKENIKEIDWKKGNDQLLSQYSDQCFQLALTCLKSESGVITQDFKLNDEETDGSDENLIQNSLYCIGSLFGVCSTNDATVIYIENCLEYIECFARFHNDGTRGEQLIRDNAISALGKIIFFDNQMLVDKFKGKGKNKDKDKVKGLLKLFMEGLPLTADTSEKKHVCRTLLKLIELYLKDKKGIWGNIVGVYLPNAILHIVQDIDNDDGDIDEHEEANILRELKKYMQNNEIIQVVSGMTRQQQQQVNAVLQ